MWADGGNNQGMEQSPPPTSSPASASAIRAWDRPVVMLPLFVLIAAVGGLFGSFTNGALLLVLAVGGTMVWLGLSGRVARRPAPASLPRSTLWWMLPILALSLVELYAFTRNSPQDY